jgi:hypothetical protein
MGLRCNDTRRLQIFNARVSQHLLGGRDITCGKVHGVAAINESGRQRRELYTMSERATQFPRYEHIRHTRPLDACANEMNAISGLDLGYVLNTSKHHFANVRRNQLREKNNVVENLVRCTIVESECRWEYARNPPQKHTAIMGQIPATDNDQSGDDTVRLGQIRPLRMVGPAIPCVTIK